MHIDGGQDHAYALAVWTLQPLSHIGYGSPHAYELAWSDDLQLGFSPVNDGLAVWRHDGDRITTVDLLPGDEARAVAPVPGQSRILVARSNALELWDLKPKRLVKSLRMAGVTCIAANSTRDVVVTGSSDGRIRLVRAGTLKRLSDLLTESSVGSCAITPDGQYAVVGDRIGRVHFFSIEK